ncbi:hypothetical protein E4U60_005685 [Claviceps pazoutovae]|uniref:non-specific serine/threonine protein kinase n=1 Tax=Claviceps pazoutovae TaxID=1649127 RepID=A0A9P7M7I2_9HYPO|nr:hypothetical protein E4U60_005685 [Claviceps pazoutovae]
MAQFEISLARLVEQAEQAMVSVHDKGVIHEDVRWENVLFNPETNGNYSPKRLKKLRGFREKQKEIFDEACDLFSPEHRAFDSEYKIRATLDQSTRAIGHESTLTTFVLDDIEISLKGILKELKVVDKYCVFFAKDVEITFKLEPHQISTQLGGPSWHRRLQPTIETSAAQPDINIEYASPSSGAAGSAPSEGGAGASGSSASRAEESDTQRQSRQTDIGTKSNQLGGRTMQHIPGSAILLTEMLFEARPRG